MKNINSNKLGAWLIVCLLLIAPFTLSAQTELLTNGGFETGNLGPWTGSQLPVPGNCEGPDWTVYTTVLTNTCNMTGLPVSSGSNAIYSGFDGNGPITYFLEQSITIPAGTNAGTLSWDESYFMFFFGGSQDRILTFEIYDAAGTTLLQTLSTDNFSPATGFYDSGNSGNTWINRVENVDAQLTAVAGQTVRLRVSAFIPEVLTGPGGMSLDNISLQVNGSPVPTLSQWGLILLGLVVITFGVVVLWKREKNIAVA